MMQLHMTEYRYYNFKPMKVDIQKPDVVQSMQQMLAEPLNPPIEKSGTALS